VLLGQIWLAARAWPSQMGRPSLTRGPARARERAWPWRRRPGCSSHASGKGWRGEHPKVKDGSHAGGGMLDYSIRGPLAPSISPGFYGWTGRGGSFSRDGDGESRGWLCKLQGEGIRCSMWPAASVGDAGAEQCSTQRRHGEWLWW
jgi:hypothetical protein